jgi:parallel beta-helix repeat protein
MTFGAIALALLASPAQSTTMIYVSSSPNLNGDGSLNNPYSSITAALATKPVAGTIIQLNQGVYSAETGESFPIKLPAGVTLRGEPTVRGINTFIKGSGKFVSPSFTSQNITILANDDVRVEGITLTNPTDRGTAIWLEKGKRVAISNNTFVNSEREGVFLAGSADAIISENVFKKNGANGLSAVGNSTGEIRNNVFEDTGFGLAIGQKSRVTINSNNIFNNTDGIVISNSAAPILRNNIIANNQRNGVVIVKDGNDHPTPDLGTLGDLGKNIFRNNLGKDLNNNSGVTQTAIGNELDLKKIGGKIAFIGEGSPQSEANIPNRTVLAPAVNPAKSNSIAAPQALPSNLQTVEPIKPIETPNTIAMRSPVLNSVAIPKPVIPLSNPPAIPNPVIPKSNTIDAVEINRLPPSNLNIPSNSSSVITPSKPIEPTTTIAMRSPAPLETLPDVPKVVTPSKPTESTTSVAMRSPVPANPIQFETLPDVPKVVTPSKPTESTTSVAMRSPVPANPIQFETLPDVPKVVTPSKPIESTTSVAMRSPVPVNPIQFESLPDVPKVVTPSKPIESTTSIAMRSPVPDKGLITDIANTQPNANQKANQNLIEAINSIEINRSPETSFNKPVTPPIALSPSSKTVILEPLPDVPSPVSGTKPIFANTPNPDNKIAQNPSKENINDILIDRDPIPITPPPQVNPPKSQFIPNNSPTQVVPNPSTTQPITPATPFKVTNPVQSSSIPTNLPQRSRIAALVPPPAIDTAPYLVVIPSSDSNVLNQVRTVVSTAKFIPSRFGYIIMIQGYPDRNRAEVLKTIVRSEMGLDARLVHQNNL